MDLPIAGECAGSDGACGGHAEEAGVMQLRGELPAGRVHLLAQRLTYCRLRSIASSPRTQLPFRGRFGAGFGRKTNVNGPTSGVKLGTGFWSAHTGFKALPQPAPEAQPRGPPTKTVPNWICLTWGSVVPKVPCTVGLPPAPGQARGPKFVRKP